MKNQRFFIFYIYFIYIFIYLLLFYLCIIIFLFILLVFLLLFFLLYQITGFLTYNSSIIKSYLVWPYTVKMKGSEYLRHL